MYTTEHRIGARDIDAEGGVRLSALVDYMQDCEGFQLGTLDMLQTYFREKNVGMYLVSRQLDLVRRPGYGERIRIATAVYECRSIYGYRNTMIYAENGETLVASYATGAFVELEGGRPVKTPHEVLKSIPYSPKIEMDYLPRKVKIPEAGGTLLPEFAIPYSYIDVNRHLNNARYIDIAYEVIPKGAVVKRVRVDYRIPATREHAVTPVLHQNEGEYLVVLGTEIGISAVISFEVG